MNDDDKTLVAKARVLLRHDQPERLLCIIVLLSRVKDTQFVQHIWNESPSLQSFCLGLLHHDNSRFSQLVIRFFSRLEKISKFDQTFQSILQERTENKSPPDMLDVDLIRSILVDQESLDVVWKRFQLIIYNECRSKITLSKDDSDWKAANSTLDALLENKEEKIVALLHDAVLSVWSTAISPSSFQTVPYWYEPMLIWSTSTACSSSLQRDFHLVLLQCTHALVLSHARHEFKALLDQNNKVATALLKVVLLYTTQQVYDDAKAFCMAWTTCAALVETFGWDWTMLASSKTLGVGGNMCTLTRLAAGEWRIQLGRNCVEMDAATRGNIAITTACGRVVLAALSFVIKVADSDSTTLSSNALLHLKSSLEDALHATVQYLVQSQLQDVAVEAVCSNALTGLLTEFNIWEGLPQGISTEEALEALGVALSCNDETSDLLPCLVSVLGSVDIESLESRALLSKHDLLQGTADYLESLWVRPSNGERSLVACQVTELWYNLSKPSIKTTTPLRRTILQWIQARAESVTVDDFSCMMAAVDCYIMLFGQDAIPSEREAIVIQRALETCESLLAYSEPQHSLQDRLYSNNE